MNVRYPSVDKIQKFQNKLSNSSRLNLGGQSIILGNNFNIAKYLNEIEKENTEKEKGRRKLNILPLLNNPLNQKRNSDLNKSKNLNNNSVLINENNFKKDKNCFITSLENEKGNCNGSKDKNRIKYYNINNNKYRKIFENKRSSNEFHLSSIVKAIKRKFNNKYNKTEDNGMSDYIAYDNRNIDSILDMNNIINKYKDNEEWDLKARENSTKEFVVKNQGISVQNVLLKLMNEQKDKLYSDNQKREDDFEKKKSFIEEDEKIFNEIVQEQKYQSRLIEDNLYKLKERNEVLLYLRENCKEHLRKTEYEILKKLYEIDELRVYAKFVNYIFGFDTSKYENNIIETDNNKKQVETEVLIKKVFENYKELLDDETEIKNNFDPDIIYNEIKLIEDRILLSLNVEDKEIEELNNLIDNNKKSIAYLEERIEDLEKEYDYLKEEEIIIKNYNSQQNNEENIYLIAQNLFTYIINTLSGDAKYNKEKKNEKYNPFDACKMAIKSQKLILDKELFLDKLLEDLDKYQKEDPKTFSQVIDSRKEELILEKVKAAKERIQNKDIIERLNIEKKSDKIYFVRRNVQPTLPKKKKIVIKLDPNIVREQEDMEILTYQ